MATELAKGSRIVGKQRASVAKEYAKRYKAGESIRSIAGDAGRSYGFVHGVLKESGVDLRGRGGATRGARKAAPVIRPVGAEKPVVAEPDSVGAAGVQQTMTVGAAQPPSAEKKAGKKKGKPAAKKSDSKAPKSKKG